MGNVITTATQVTPLVEEAPNAMAEAIISASRNDASIPNAIMNVVLAGFSSNAESFYRYGRDRYINGLPEGSKLNTVADTPEIQLVIESIEGEAITIVSSFYASADYDYFVFEYLHNNYNFNYDDKIIYGFGAGEGYGGLTVHYTGFTVDDDATTITIHTHTKNPDGSKSATFFIYMPAPKAGLYYHASYWVNSDITQNTVHWTYDPATNTYPNLTPEDEVTSKDDFLPIVTIRDFRIYVNKDEESELYRTTKGLLDTISIDVDELIENIAENGNLNDILHIFVLFGVDINTKQQDSMLYLINFFLRLELQSVYKKHNYDRHDPRPNTFIINDNDFNTKLSYNYIFSENKAGSIGEIGHITSSVYIDKDSTGLYYSRDYITYKLQIEDNVYLQIVVHGPVHITNIYKDYDVWTHLSDTDHRFFIPLERSVLKEFSVKQETLILYESLIMVMYAYNREHVDYYKKSNFIKLVQITIVVVLIATGQIELVAPALSWAAAGEFALTLLATYAITYSTKLLAKEIGIENSAWFVAALAVYTAYNLDGGGFLNAEQLMTLTSSMIQGINELTVEDTVELQDETEDWLKSVDEFNEEIEEARDLLNTGFMNPLDLVIGTNYFNSNEEPADFFSRTIDPNPGLKVFEQMDNYYDYMLELPEENTLLNAAFKK